MRHILYIFCVLLFITCCQQSKAIEHSPCNNADSIIVLDLSYMFYSDVYVSRANFSTLGPTATTISDKNVIAQLDKMLCSTDSIGTLDYNTKEIKWFYHLSKVGGYDIRWYPEQLGDRVSAAIIVFKGNDFDIVWFEGWLVFIEYGIYVCDNGLLDFIGINPRRKGNN